MNRELNPVCRKEYYRGRFSEIHEYYDENSYLVSQLVEYKINGDNKLFKVYATIANIKPCIFPYYVAAKSKKEARQIFSTIVTWLKISKIEPCSDSETIEVCTNPKKNICYFRRKTKCR